MDNSPFSALPSELRNLIWEHALYSPTGVPINTEPGLLQTCKGIRKEAELMFYALNSFNVEIKEDHIQHRVCKWLQSLGETKRKLIRGLHVHCVIASAAAIAEEIDEPAMEEEEDSFMQLMHLLDSIRGTDFGRGVENVVRFTVSTSGDTERDPVFDDTKSFDEMDRMTLEKQECYRAAKFLILCCVYGKEALVEAMESSDGEGSIAELDRRIQENRKEYAMSTTAVPL